MAVRINIDPDLQNFYRCPGTVEVAGKTVGECLDRLVIETLSRKDAPSKGGVLDGTLVFLNRKTIYDIDRPVNDGDELDIIVMPYGG